MLFRKILIGYQIMALDLNTYLSNVKLMLAGLTDEVQVINTGLAISAIPLIINRLTDLGIDGTGKKLGTYSTNPLPTFFYLHKGTGSGADTALEALVKKKQKSEGKNFKGISYAEFRTLNNRPIDFVTLNFTGETLNDLGVIDNIINGLVVIITVGAENKVTKKKYKANGAPAGTITSGEILDYLGERYGENILALNDEEQEQLAVAYDSELQKYIDKKLGE